MCRQVCPVPIPALERVEVESVHIMQTHGALAVHVSQDVVSPMTDSQVNYYNRYDLVSGSLCLLLSSPHVCQSIDSVCQMSQQHAIWHVCCVHTFSSTFIKLCRGLMEQRVHSKCQVKLLDIEGFNVGFQR